MSTKTKGENGQVEEIDLDTARAIVAQAEEKRRQAFIEEYKALCQKYGYQLAPPQTLEVVEIRR